MIFYLIFFLIAIILSMNIIPVKRVISHSNGRIFYKRTNLWFMLYIFVTLVIGLRYRVGTDYMSYVKFFRYYQSGFNFPNVEFGYEFLNQIIISFGLDYWAVFLICAGLTNFLVLKTIKKESNYFLLSIVILFGLGFFFRQTNHVRQMVAVGFFFYSGKYIVNKDLKKYIVCSILGMLFHFSIIFMIPMYWLANLRLKKSILVLLCSISLTAFIFPKLSINVISFLKDYLTPPVYSHYAQSSFYLEGVDSGLRIIIEILILIIAILILPKNIVSSKKSRIYYNLVVYGFISKGFLARFRVFNRLPVYFLVYLALFVPDLLYYLKINKYIKIIIFMLVFSYYGLLTFMAIKGNSHDIIPYQTVFNL